MPPYTTYSKSVTDRQIAIGSNRNGSVITVYTDTVSYIYIPDMP
jgi:hypothetical protein